MEMQDSFDFVVNTKAVTFQLAGVSYPPEEDNFRITEDGEIRETEDNDLRILE